MTWWLLLVYLKYIKKDLDINTDGVFDGKKVEGSSLSSWRQYFYVKAPLFTFVVVFTHCIDHLKRHHYLKTYLRKEFYKVNNNPLLKNWTQIIKEVYSSIQREMGELSKFGLIIENISYWLLRGEPSWQERGLYLNRCLSCLRNEKVQHLGWPDRRVHTFNPGTSNHIDYGPKTIFRVNRGCVSVESDIGIVSTIKPES